MKKIFIILFLSFSVYSFAQTRKIKSFIFQNNKIDYSRIDYSNYGIAHFFITMYSSDSSYNLIEQSAYNCLLREDRIYHTLYFFIRVPSNIKDPELKSLLFTEFVDHIKKEEKIEKVNLYLNFDQDYSVPYISKKEKKINDVKRVIDNMSVKTICKTLTIR